MKSFDVLIVGAGQAGAMAAVGLRQKEFKGSIAIVGDEVDPPYERPPLSKAYLSGDVTLDKILLRTPEFWTTQQVEMITGEHVVRVDADRRVVTCTSGSDIEYGQLIWCTGGSARRMTCPGAGLEGIHVVRTRAQVDRLRSEVSTSKQVVIVGGGYIGLETAAVLAKSGKSVTVLEAQHRVLERVTSATVSAFFQGEHRAHGVHILTGAHVESFTGEDGKVHGVVLADGTRLPADLVVVGIGLVPEVAALRAAGAVCSNGVDVDDRCRTSLNGIYAIGDCANHPNAFARGQRIRLESVQNANDQAKVVAGQIVGVDSPYHAVPWFWSQQYDIKLQTVGLCGGHDAVVVRGTPSTRSFSVIYLREGKVIALDCINAPKDYVHGRRLVAQGVEATAEELTDTARELAKVGVQP